MTVRWGIIGCGEVTEIKSGPAFQKAPGSALVMVMRRDGANAEDYARRHGVPRWTTDAEALIHDPEVDAVYVATPPGMHLEYALRVAAACKLAGNSPRMGHGMPVAVMLEGDWHPEMHPDSWQKPIGLWMGMIKSPLVLVTRRLRGSVCVPRNRS